MLDMNDAELPRNTDILPDGSFVKITMQIRRGGLDGLGEADRGLLKGAKSPSSDVRMLDCEFTITDGPLARRKFWQTFTVMGGKLDDNGVSIGWKISKGMFRAMIDSALGLDPQDMSDAARGKRVLRGLSDLHGITFGAKLRVEPASDARYSETNKIDRVLVDAECTHDGSIKHLAKFAQWGWETFERRFLDTERLTSLTTLQAALLAAGFRALKPGGTLVYSTCSFARAQNEAIVEAFVRAEPRAELVPIESLRGAPCRAGDVPHTLRFEPRISQTSGLFVAKLTKLAGVG
jgi:hypothetical protein